MKSQWKHFSEARSSVADFLHKMTAQYRDREDSEAEAQSLLLRWLVAGKLQANAYQIIWKRGSGAFGEGAPGGRYSIDRDGNRLAGPVIAIPQQFWQQWQSADYAAKSIVEYRHYDHDKSVYVVATEDPARPLDASFAASDFKLEAAGQGEIYRVVVVEWGALRAMISALAPVPPSLNKSATQEIETTTPARIDWHFVQIAFDERVASMGRSAFADMTYTGAGDLVAELIAPYPRTTYTDRKAGVFRGAARSRIRLPQRRGR